MSIKNKHVNSIFIFYILFESFGIIKLFLESNTIFYTIFTTLSSLSIYILFIYFFFHSLNYNCTTLLFAGVLWGYVVEHLGVNYGLIFGKYYYSTKMTGLFKTMSIATPFSWSVIIYTCYFMTNIVMNGIINERYYINKYHFFTLPLLSSIMDGLLAMNIDMILDPVAVKVGGWVWNKEGQYFGIPLSNFFGWFITTFIITYIFRLLYKDKKRNKIENRYSLPIIITYSTYLIKHILWSQILQEPVYSLIGISAMMPMIITTIVIIKYRKN